jgi:membrane-associated phospholipid phosphatase
MARVSQLRARVLPQGPFDAVRQFALFAAAYYLYRIVRGLVDGQAAAAFDHARTLVDLERGMGLFFEPGLQAWAIDNRWIVDGANWMYVNSHFMITVGFLTWLYIARNGAFYYVRNMFMVAMGLALAGYVLFPTAPPRFLPEWGFTDTVTEFVGQGASATAGALYNPFAAVPSMHVAFALMIGIPAMTLVRHWPLRIVWGLYPVLVSFVVLVTGNHFWLDVALGALVAAVSAWAAHAALARARPEAWGWQAPVRAEASL